MKYFKKLIDNLFSQIILGVTSNMALIHYLIRLKSFFSAYMSITLALLATLCFFFTSTLIALIYFYKKAKKYSVFKPHTCGLLQNNDFFYCSNHDVPKLVAVSLITSKSTEFTCPGCKEKWTIYFGNPNLLTPKTHMDFCKKPLIPASE